MNSALPPLTLHKGCVLLCPRPFALSPSPRVEQEQEQKEEEGSYDAFVSSLYCYYYYYCSYYYHRKKEEEEEETGLTMRASSTSSKHR